MKKTLPYIFIVLFFVILYFSPFMYLFFTSGRMQLDFIKEFLGIYTLNPVNFVSNYKVEVTYPGGDYAVEDNAFSEISKIDSDSELPSEVPFSYNDIKPMPVSEFIDIRDRNLFGDGKNRDKSFVIIDVLNAEIGERLVGGRISYSLNQSLMNKLVTTTAYCQSDNTYVYNSDWELQQGTNVDFDKALENGNQLVTSCLTEDCLYVGTYCAIVKW